MRKALRAPCVRAFIFCVKNRQSQLCGEEYGLVFVCAAFSRDGKKKESGPLVEVSLIPSPCPGLDSFLSQV